MPFPHPKVHNIRRCSRLVILPDYQGIGLGVKFITAVAELYKKEGYDFRIVTTLKNFSKSLVKSGKFLLKDCSIKKPNGKISSVCRKVKTCSFKFVGGVHG
jgi:GNAT superfamily N-acetyltransferase